MLKYRDCDQGGAEQKLVVSLNLKKSSNGDGIHELKKPFRVAVECET